ncbi:mitochondrial ribosome-associated GTPase 2-like [Saccostrea echinata]|uniref:mitochondrial ribosome-associated GTPase 2-like n=1 Tax=Saccostrea echinata TaxID=191078 RepID=UPI002A824984|nr:mitochondrial ribosome-associated GTPase 2-like [Saccostrea echinata]
MKNLRRCPSLPFTYSKLKLLNQCFEKNIVAVFSSYRPLLPRTKRGVTNEAKHFIDYKEVQVYGGDGGDGCMSFAKIPRKEFAGPDGGDGGNGGHVIFIATTTEKSLNHLSSDIRADKGVAGKSQNCHGASVDHTYVKVPMGTVISSMNGQELANLECDGDYYVAGRGGVGGKGNQFFLSNENRAPTIAEKGGKGEYHRLRVELRTMANIGLIGFPNAGKSTLLRAITRAKPKVAAYPFTTRNPFVGIMEYSDHEQITVADIPGLIVGAHKNLGLGFSFLQHIQRCACLLYVIDLSYTEPWTQFRALQYELEQYQEGLSTRPNLIVANKVDLSVAEKNLEVLKANVDLPVIAISAAKQTGIEELMMEIRKLYEKHKSDEKKTINEARGKVR